MKNAFKNIRNTWTKIKPGCKLPEGVSHGVAYMNEKVCALYVGGILDLGVLICNSKGKPLCWQVDGTGKRHPLYPKPPAYWMKIDLPGEE